MTVLMRRLAAGFLAGLSSVVGLLAVLLLLFFGGGIFSLVREIAIARSLQRDVPFWSSLGQALIQSFAALPSYVWSGRWAMLLLGLIGLALAMVDGLRVRVARPWHDYTGFVATIGLITALVVGLTYANQDVVHTWIADQPYLFSQQEALLVSDATLLGLGLLVAIASSYIVWAAWNSWYTRWSAWLHVRRQERERPTTPTTTAPARSEMLEYQARLARLRSQTPADEPRTTPDATMTPADKSWTRSVLVALGAALLLSYLLLRLFHTVGPAVTSGGFWVTAEAPRAAAALPFNQPPRRVTISNTGGFGTVNIRLSTGRDATPLREIESMSLSGGPDRFEISNVDLSGLPAGDYRIDASLREGQGGLLRYVALSGGGLPGQFAAAAIGLAVGLVVALAAVLVLEVRAERGAFRSAG